MSIGENIRTIREFYGLTQKEMGVIAGVSESAVSIWEADKTQPRMGAVQKIADHFGIRKSYIVEEGGAKEFAEAHRMVASKADVSELDQQILDGIKRLKPDQRKAVESLIQSMLSDRE